MRHIFSLNCWPFLPRLIITAIICSHIPPAFAQLCSHCPSGAGTALPIVYTGLCVDRELAPGEKIESNSSMDITLTACSSCITFHVTTGSCTNANSFWYTDMAGFETTFRLEPSSGGVHMSARGTLCLKGDPCDVKTGERTLTATDAWGNTATTKISFQPPSDCDDCADCEHDTSQGDGSDSANTIAASSAYMGSAANFVKLGRGAFGKKLGGLAIHEKMPMSQLCTPQCLQVPRTNKYTQVITNINGVRQVKVTEGLADIVTNAAHKYTINVYPTNAIGATNADGTYQVSGSTIASITVENPDVSCATSNRVTITDGEGLVSEFEYTATGWELTKANGAAKRKKTSVVTESNTRTTSTNELRNSTNGLVSTHSSVFKEYGFGPRLLETVKGTGSEAITNTQTWYTNTASYTTGLLQQVIRSDGFWEIKEYNTNRFATNHVIVFLNQAPTSNGALARMFEYGYGSNVIPGAPDAAYSAPFRPRRTVEYVLGKEASRGYYTLKRGEQRQIQCVTTNAAWDAADNLVTITRYYTNGPNDLRLRSVEYPDGTLLVRDYLKATNNLYVTNITMVGAPDSYKTNVVDGTKTISIRGHVGQQLSRTEIDIVSGITNSHEAYSDFDDRNRPRKVTYLDGTFTWTDYGCCGPINFTNREGTAFKTLKDALNRSAGRQNVSLNITTTNIYDAGKNLAQRKRIGSDASSVTNVSYTYDTAGRITSSRDALGYVSTFSESISNFQLTRTTTYPDGGTRIEEYYRDGQLAKVTGTAVNPIRYEYGVEADDGVSRLYTKEIKLDAGGNDTSEWVKTYKDMVGRPYKVLYADGSKRERFYNTKGQLIKEIDPDGVTTLFTYNARGKVEYTAIDLNRNGTIDFNGTDRITQTVRSATSNGAHNVHQTRTYAWSTNNSAISNLTATIETSTDALRSWNNTFGLTNKIQRVFSGSGNRYETNTAPDGSLTINHFLHGQLLDTTRKDANGSQIGKTTFTYDTHGRRSTSTDARNGATVFTYDAADRVLTTRTPAPGNGQNSQNTSYAYGSHGHLTQTVLPDSTIVYNVYSLKGELLTNYGSRAYPVSYAYDHQGRRTNMVTWTNFASRGGAAITSWKFDGLRGFMTNKVYADGNGPSYTYTAAGKLRTRKWARGITTTYETNAATDIIGITYSDSTTSNATYNLDRLGHRTNIVDGAGTRVLSYTSFGSLSLETNASGVLAGTAIGYQYDSLQRRTNLALYTPSSIVNHSYSFDSASRLSTVSDGTYNATYDYLANSPLVSQITYKSNTTTRMTTIKKYDFLNRLLDITSIPSASPAVKFSYQYNAANKRVRRTDSDESYWAYEYDSLGQVTSAKHFWPDGVPLAGQQFEYAYDDIGNRRRTKEGGDARGSGLRIANYTVNNLNQCTQRDVPGAADIIGIAHPSASVSVNDQSVYRRGEYYHNELTIDNASAPVWQSVTNQAIYTGQTNITTGNLLLPKTPQSLWYDNDGNTLSDSVWTNSWDGENRLAISESTTAVAPGARARETWVFNNDGRWVERVISSWSGSMYVPQSTNRFIWSGAALLAVLDGTSSMTMSLLRDLDLSGKLPSRSGVSAITGLNIPTNGFHFCASDANGNVASLIDGAGTVSGTYEYEPFAKAIRLDGIAGRANQFRFSSQFSDSVRDTVKYLYREQVSSLGIWLNRDPLAERAGANLYSFVENNPVSKWDVLGLTVHLAPLNGRVVNNSSVNVEIMGDWTELDVLHGEDASVYTVRPWSSLQYWGWVNDPPLGDHVQEERDITDASANIAPGESSEGLWNAGLIYIVDVDSIEGASKPVYTNRRCCTAETFPIRVSLFTVTVRNCSPFPERGIWVSYSLAR